MEAKILVAEDNKGLSLLFSKILERNGYEVVLAGNGVEAFTTLMTEEGIDIIFLDIMMPQLDGIGFLEKAKSIIKEKRIKICMLSALSEMDKIQQCLSLGADDYIIKVADEELLVNKVRFLGGQLPKYEYSKIECQHKESILVNSECVDITLTEVHEDFFVFKTKYDLERGTRITITNGKVWDMIGTSQDILARVFRVRKDAGIVTAFANYVGLTENQIKALRSKTVRGGEEKNEE